MFALLGVLYSEYALRVFFHHFQLPSLGILKIKIKTRLDFKHYLFLTALFNLKSLAIAAIDKHTE